MITRAEWTSILVNLGKEMKAKGTIYRWKSPVNESVTMKNSTCVGYIGLAMQRAGLLPKGYYVHMENGKLLGNGATYIKNHPEMFQVLWVRASPKVLGTKLQVGDICLYNVPHIMAFAARNKAGTPLWYSLERSSKGIGYPAKLTIAGTFGYYTNRKIECIIRPKFATTTQKPSSVPNASTNVSKPAQVKYKTKQAMNVRKGPGTKYAVVVRIPKGAVVTVVKNLTGSTWKLIEYCKEQGYMNCASQYATKL